MKENSGYFPEPGLSDIAIIGMACRFPGAKNIAEFWHNLITGKESIQRFTAEELRNSGEAADKIADENYVNARGVVADPELFDASFFGFSATDARLLDPQHRFFLECGWEALESAGYASEKCKELIGVYASMAESTYLQEHLVKNRNIMQSTDWLQLRIANSLTTLGTQLSYRLNLKGPSVNVTTACSSSLVTIISACKALLDYDCDIALAGSSVIAIPQHRGYLYEKGGIESADGHCRAFDEDATGTVFSDGVGVVVLKRLADAVKDQDFIYATIKSWNINNDGSDKAGYTAPSVRGQARCIVSAANFGSIDLESLGYIETHGTGTAMGDPIEINAMRMAFETQTQKQQFCAIGSVKTNIGHADIAAGMASIIKTALMLKHQVIPASLHYKKSNPAIHFEQTPFYVNDQFNSWPAQPFFPRRAGINSSGIGGTNAFLILEEARKGGLPPEHDSPQLILVSAKTPAALSQASINIFKHIEENSDINLSSLAYTLQIGRADFALRRAIICQTPDELLTIQSQNCVVSTVPASHPTGRTSANNRHNSDPLLSSVAFHHCQSVAKQTKIVFMFPGQGAQYSGMCEGLYHSEPEFAKLINDCLMHVSEDIKHEVALLLFGVDNAMLHASKTLIAQPALFIFEYALGTFLMNLGIIPDALIGHSLGEYVAACLSGVMDFQTTLHLIQLRAQLMEMTEAGSMLAVSCNEIEALQLIQNRPLSIAACNTSSNTIISGPVDEVRDFIKELNAKHLSTKSINTTHAFHSTMMTPIIEDFARGVEKIAFQHPTIPIVSNLTGEWVQDHEITNPEYWINHILQTVRFVDGLDLLVENDFNVFLEVGPGHTLTQFIRETSKNDAKLLLRNLNNRHPDMQTHTIQWLQVLAELWLMGVQIDWEYFNRHRAKARIPLPTYPFQRQKFWISPSSAQDQSDSYQKQAYDQWFYEPSWKRTSFLNTPPEQPYAWILLQDELGIGDALQRYLLENHHIVFLVKRSTIFQHCFKYEYGIDIANKEHYSLLIQSILSSIDLPLYIVNLLPLTAPISQNPDLSSYLDLCFYSSLFLAQAFIESQYNAPLSITVIGNEILSVLGEKVAPVKASVIGPCRVIPLEHEHFKIKIIDIGDPQHYKQKMSLVSHIIADTLTIKSQETVIAYRENYRWIQRFTNIPLPNKTNMIVRNHGIFLVTGGLGGIALTLVEHIAQQSQSPKFILLSRAHFPAPQDWNHWLDTHPSEDATAKKILKLEKIIKTGAEIYIYQANVSNETELSAVLTTIKAQFGALHGVIHCAGTPGGGLVQFKTKEMVSKVFEPKILGTYLLCKLLQDESLDFMVLCSSINAIMGDVSLVDYCSANACLDAFPHSGLLHDSHTVFTSINWNTWREVGMAVETDKPADISYFKRNNDISPSEGAQIFGDGIRLDTKQLIISTLPLQRFIEQMHAQAVQNEPAMEFIERHTIMNEDNPYQAPNTEIEIQLAKIWQEIFSLDKIGIGDDFFALGGHSLKALHLLNKIERQFKVTISISLFLEQATTIEKLAKIIGSGVHSFTPSSSIVIPIRSSGRHPPLFCFHPVAGTIFCYAGLAKYLKYDAPIYGIQDPSITHGSLMFTSMEEMAAAYILEIKKIQPKGPYYLGGLSFGATLAAEVARQLRMTNDTTQVLFFFDGWAKFSDEQHIETIFKDTIIQLYDNRPDSKKLSDMAWERMRILLKYDVQPIQEPVFLYKAKTLLPEYRDINDPYNYWTQHVSTPIHLQHVPGTHETILDEPNIKTLAALVDNMLMEIKEGAVV